MGLSAAASFRWLLLFLVLACVAWAWWRSRVDPLLPGTKPPPANTNRFITLRPPPTDTAPKPILKPAVEAPPPPVRPPEIYPRPVWDVFEAQVALDRQAISPGCIDGSVGSQTRAALEVFQRKMKLPVTGRLDTNTRPVLRLERPALTTRSVTSNDLARLQPVSKTWLGKSTQSAMDFETILELVAEESFSSQNFIQHLNPNVNWSKVRVGTLLALPDASYPEPRQKAAFVTIRLGARTLEAFDSATNLLAHFPCSIAAKVEKRPAGELRVELMVENPNYTFSPDVFPESAEARDLGRKLIVPPGPNNPVGVAWIGLNLPGYGIHGTPNPEQVGRTESHGCFRLANWNAAFLLKLAWVGMPVYVVK